MVFYNSLKNCAKNSNHNKLEITSRGSPSVMLRLSLLMDSAFVYINCWAHFDGSIEKWRKNLNCYRKSSSTSFARFLSSLASIFPVKFKGKIMPTTNTQSYKKLDRK